MAVHFPLDLEVADVGVGSGRGRPPHLKAHALVKRLVARDILIFLVEVR